MKVEKTKLTLSIDKMKVRELKKRAIDADMDLSDFLAVAGTITPISKISDNRQLTTIQDTSGAAVKK